MIEQEDARFWLRGRKFDLILTDPPHGDRFDGGQSYRRFVHSWIHNALPCLKNGVLIHSVGPAPYEAKTYLDVWMPDQILVWPWPHEPNYTSAPEGLLAPSHHLFFVYLGPGSDGRRWSGETVLGYRGGGRIEPFEKDDLDLWKKLITAFCPHGGVVGDPFCGRGEIPRAAREVQREWQGCDVRSAAVDYCRSLGL